MTREFREAVRVDKIEIEGIRWYPESKRTTPEILQAHETHVRWEALTTEIQRLHNFVWRFWITWHTVKEHHLVVVEYMEVLRLWHITPKEDRVDEKPKCSIQAFPKELVKELLPLLQKQFPSINSRPIGLAFQKLQETIKHGAGVKSAFPRWMQILADELGPPSFCRAMPIPLCNERCHIIQSVDGSIPDEKKEYKAEFRIDRIETEGGRAKSTLDVVALKTKHRTQKLVERLISGEYKRCGGSLTWDHRKRVWTLNLGYRQPIIEKPALDKSRIAITRASAIVALVVEIDGKEIPIGGKCRNVAALRMMLDVERNSRNENYRWSPGVGKGHGRQRARTQRFEDFINKWGRFCKTMNYQMVAEILRRCEENNCGAITFEQPDSETEQTALLFLAGKTERTRIASGWPWHRLAAALQQKANELNIECVVRKGESTEAA